MKSTSQSSAMGSDKAWPSIFSPGLYCISHTFMREVALTIVPLESYRTFSRSFGRADLGLEKRMKSWS